MDRMNCPSLSQRIEAAQSHIESLIDRAGPATGSHGAGAEFLQETSALVKELQAIGEELGRQREELDHEGRSNRMLAQVRKDRDSAETLATALEAERRVLQVIMENTRAQLAYLDPEFNFLRVNSAYVRGSGFRREQLIGHNHFDLFPDPENRAIFERVRDTGEPVAFRAKPFEFPGRPALGITYWDWTLVPIEGEGEQAQGLVLSLIDVTERERTRRALRRYADRLQVLREMDQAILAAESVNEIARRTLRYVPRLIPCLQATVALFDLEAGEMSVFPLHAESEARESEGWRSPLDADWAVENLGQGQIYAAEDVQALSSRPWLVEAMHVDGVRAFFSVPLIVRGQLIGSLNLGMASPGTLDPEHVEIARETGDQLAIAIQQARLHEHLEQHADDLEREVARRTRALRASEARFRAVFQGAGVGIVLTDRTGRVLDVNPALQEMLGYNAEELVGLLFTDLPRHLDDDADDDDQFADLIAGKRDLFRTDRRYVRQDGESVWANLTVSLVRGSRGTPRHAIAMVDDITEWKQAQAALIQSEKLAVTGRLAASLAHEINNPLQSVIGCLGLAEESLAAGDEEDVFELLQIGTEELERAAGIVGQLRDLNQPSRPEDKEPTDVRVLLGQVLMLTKKQSQKRGVVVTLDAPEDELMLMLVPDRMQQVFLNLVLNAVEAMPRGGRLEVGVCPTAEPRGASISFSDSGRGIAPADLSHIFDPFYTTKPDGLGLGLYVTRNIVKQHGGHIEVKSCVGQGTTFEVWLPV